MAHGFRRPTIAVILAAACGAGALPAQGAAGALRPGDWPSPARTLEATRFSPLTQLTPATAGHLRLLWSFSTGNLEGHEGNPLVVGNRLYLHTPHPVAVYAFDLENPGSPPLWKYAPATRDPALSACCGGSSRGIAWHPSGRLIVPLFPGDLAAIDAQTGRELWRVRNGNPSAGLTMPAAPLVVGSSILVGVAGGEFGARGYLSAHDVETGRLRWRGFSTGPDADVLITGPANPAYPTHQARELGASTWPGGAWMRGGGATWGWLSADTSLGLVYYGTGAPAPHNPLQRLGQAKWTSSLVARELATGRVRWAVQLTPADAFGYDASNESILADLTVAGRPVKALVHFDRNGFAYTIDRVTGRILVAEKYGPANWATSVNLATGIPVTDTALSRPGPVTGVCPSMLGMKGFQPAAYSPLLNRFFVPVVNLCMDLTRVPASFAAGKPYLGVAARFTAGPGGNRGRFIAWDATNGSIAWETREPFPVMGGALVTAGGVVVYGTMDGWLKALDAVTGREVWRHKAPSGFVGNPIAFSDADGRIYLAVVSGVGGWLTLGQYARNVLADSLGPRPLMNDLGRIINPGGTLLVFGL